MRLIIKFPPAGLAMTFIFFYIPLANADRQSIMDDTINCSALFYILTSSGIENPKFGQEMTGWGMMMGNLWGTHKRKITGARITKGDVTRLRNKKAVELGKLYDANPDAVVDEYLFCNQWRKSLAIYFSEQKLQTAIDTKNNKRIDQIVLNIPIGPDRESLDSNNKGNAKKIIDIGFQAWAKFNRMTTDDVRKMLEDMTKKNKK